MDQIVTEEIQRLGLAGRIIRTFYAPSKTFASVRQQQTWQDWFAPVTLVVLLTMIAGFITMPILMQAGSEIMQEQLNNMPEEQRAMMEEMQGSMQTAGLVMVPIGGFIGLFVAGAILLALANFILGGEATYGQMLAVYGYASLVGIVRLIVTTPLMLAKKTAIVHSGLGIFLAEEMPSTFMERILVGVDFFILWQVVIIAIGIGEMVNCSTKKALISLLILWAIWLVIQAALGGIGALFGQGG